MVEAARGWCHQATAGVDERKELRLNKPSSTKVDRTMRAAMDAIAIDRTRREAGVLVRYARLRGRLDGDRGGDAVVGSIGGASRT